MIGIVDLKICNVGSVGRALSLLKLEHRIASEPAGLSGCERIILPGVGTFSEASRRLESTGFRDELRDCTLQRGIPILGICLGMQLLASRGCEGGESQGLDLIPGRVIRLESSDSRQYRVPHMGWNTVEGTIPGMFSRIEEPLCFYFVHSYHFSVEVDVPQARCYHGQDFVAAVRHGHIWGTQFHPEKSQSKGIKVLENFVKYAHA